ncbi:PAS/PAC sensor signal transduction histidine kinase [Hoeflea halophila]|uniref:histidine kinase n=1 Tax=Hoeflea halophila TaxID=714899 RepID=A0A286IGN6_9HYPH|nr:ATP-binding protein [Hoeflea halophila]SOE18529.1 PAS/PAC sensor signal transduction histidine kinase [Hoeflea halophila]
MPAHHYPFIELAVHAAVRDHFAKGNAVAVLSRDLDEVLWANGAAAQLLGFSNIYDVLDEGFDSQTATRRQIESAVSGLGRTGRPQNFMMRASSGFSRTMTPATLQDFTLPDGVPALLLTSSQPGQVMAPGARARQIIAGFEGTGTHVAVLDADGRVLAATSTFADLGLADADIDRMVADVTGAADRLVKRMTASPIGAMPTAIGRLADNPALHLLFAVEPAPAETAPNRHDGETQAAAAARAIIPVGGAASEPETASSAPSTGASDAPESGSESTGSAKGTADAAAETAEAEDEGPEATAAETRSPANSDEATGTQTPPRRPFFDTRRIRDELNARLAKAEQESKLPTAFEDARGLEVPSFADERATDTQAPAADNEVPQEEERSADRAGDAENAATEQVIDGAEADGSESTIAEAADPSDVTAVEAEADSGHSVPVDDGEAGTGDEELAATPVDDTVAADETSEKTVPATAQDAPDVEDEYAGMDGAGDEASAENPASAERQFRFDPNRKPARFVWKINKDGEFSEVSPEFAAAVGPHSADIIGRKFPDLARVFNLDPDHIISDLLNRRDTWSGKTVFWPVQGTDLVTPVDLAALPTYTRDRRFDGFRGFGIVRTGETRKDPEALGLALVPGSVSRPAAEAQEAGPAEETHDQLGGEAGFTRDEDLPVEDQSELEMRDLERDIDDLARMDGTDSGSTGTDSTGEESGRDNTAETGDPADESASDTSEADNDPFMGERPAIRLVETPMRRDSDKIIDLEARRPRTPMERLSPGEQAAFREIGARLSKANAEAEGRNKTTDKADAGAESAPPVLPQEQPASGRQQAAENDGQTGVAAEAQPGEPDSQSGSAGSDGAAGADQQESASEPAETAARADDAGSDQARPVQQGGAGQAGTGQAETDPASPDAPLPSAFALPRRQGMSAGLDAGLIDAIPAALLVHSGDELIHGNADFFELTGYTSLEELSDCGGLDHLLERPDADDEASDGGLFVRRGDGSRREITARLRSVNWRDGQALLLALSPRESAVAPAAEAATVIPLAEAKDDPAPKSETLSRENALVIEAQELRSILETATDGVVILNNDGTIRSMNGSACALFNYDDSETRDQPFAMLFAHESQRAVMDYVTGLADHGVSSVLNDGREVIGREASGGFLPLFMTIGRLTGSNGYCAVLRDITNWKRTEEELRNAKRAAETANSHKSDFLARVSHEIRTPLNAIIGFSEMMVEERFGPIGSPRYLEYAHDIGNSGKHVLDIVNDLLDISKIEAGQVSMEFVSVSLNDHLAESVALLQPMANSQRVIIRTSLSASVPEVVADQRSIKQIALNLLSNAIRYTPSGGQIVVSTSYEPSGNVVLRIRDTGIGMNRKELEQAMKPFGQVGTGPRQRGDGTGLGLPLTKAMVEANRAQFEIVSAPGEGTLVSISFPPQRVLAD